MLIRHAEKPVGHDQPYGVDPDGRQDDKSLTITGWTRAGALVGLFAPEGADGPLSLRPGLAPPSAIVAANPDGASRRPFQTVGSVAARTGVSIDIRYAKGQERELAEELRNVRVPTLVAWEHQSIPAIVAHLGAVQPAPPAEWPGDRFDLVWCFSRDQEHGWLFTEVPQLLLAGDRGIQ